MKAVKSSVYSDFLGFFCGAYLQFLWPSDGDLQLITEPCFTEYHSFCLNVIAISLRFIVQPKKHHGYVFWSLCTWVTVQTSGRQWRRRLWRTPAWALCCSQAAWGCARAVGRCAPRCLWCTGPPYSPQWRWAPSAPWPDPSALASSPLREEREYASYMEKWGVAKRRSFQL